MADVIKVSDIIKTYQLGGSPVQVLKGVSMTVASGELVALMGASGSGKTTLMNILGCLDRPTSGSYQLDGHEISSMAVPQRARIRNEKIGFVFQNFNLLPRTTALENVLLPMAYANDAPRGAKLRQRGIEMLERVGLGDRLDHHPSQLSGGQQQRVAIARALINNPRLLLADEPTGNLDSRTSEEVLKMFQHLNREQNLTILLVTHAPEVAQHASRVIHIKDGLIESGAPALTPQPAFPAGGS
jgi:ABC-type lipoprotein export system ATPase subunit